MKKIVLTLFVCPSCKGTLSSVRAEALMCLTCNVRYPIERGIPVLVDRSILPSHLLRQIQYFEEESQTYSISYRLDPWQKKYVDRFFTFLPSCKEKIIVDDGCGSGYMAIEAAKRGALVIACDLNMSSLIRIQNISHKLGLRHTLFPVCCSSESLPIRSKMADGIVANAILEHLPKEQQAVAEITRIAKKGTIAMITVPIAYHLLNPLFLLVNYVYDKRIGHLRRYTKEILQSRFERWKLYRVQYTGHTAKVLKTLINLIFPIFSEEQIEKEEEQLTGKQLFASNVSIIFKK